MLPHQRSEREKRMNHNHYSTKRNIWELVAMILAILFLLAMIGLNLFVRAEPDPEVVTYPMVNSRIVWEGAGYSGIYGGD